LTFHQNANNYFGAFTAVGIRHRNFTWCQIRL